MLADLHVVFLGDFDFVGSAARALVVGGMFTISFFVSTQRKKGNSNRINVEVSIAVYLPLFEVYQIYPEAETYSYSFVLNELLAGMMTIDVVKRASAKAP